MKTSLLSAVLLLAGMAVSAADVTAVRQTYPAAPDNVCRKAAEDIAKAPDSWKNAPLAYYVVPPMSDLIRTSVSYPADGVAFGDFQIVAAKNEFEPASAVFFPRQNVDKFLPKATDLKSASGAVIPAKNVDIKVVKVWYQCGSAWYSQFNDTLRAKLIPEMLLNDENMVIVDTKNEENLVRYNNKDGSVSYQWMNTRFDLVNYEFDGQANIGLIADSPVLLPAVLNKNEFKQYFFTVHVPKDAAEGIYTGSIVLEADGKTVGSIPLKVRVLPFELPAPKTNYDSSKGFYMSLYRTDTKNPEILKNLAEHNVLNPMGFPAIDVFHPEDFRKDLETAKKAGINTKPLFDGAHDTALQMSLDPKGLDKKKLDNLKRIIAETREIATKELGHTDFYSYGVDEGSPAVIRRERMAWQVAHEAGGKVMVTTHPKGELLFALDYMNMPRLPSPGRAAEVRQFHKANPKGLCGWYADPHSGPENPDFFRRIHGFLSWKNDYDVAANYCWWRNNWNDFSIPYESNYRAIIMVMAGRDGVFNTVVWEGVREGMDDVRYASLMRELALEAMESKDPNTVLLGRRIMSQLAYTDEQRKSLDAIRMECIRNILALRKALGKGN